MKGYLPLLFIVVMFLGFYFLIMRPAQRRQKEARELVAGIQVGQEVMTTAGIYGTLTEIADDTVELEVAPGVRMKYAKAAVARIVEPTEPAETAVAAEPPATAVIDGDKHS